MGIVYVIAFFSSSGNGSRNYLILFYFLSKKKKKKKNVGGENISKIKKKVPKNKVKPKRYTSI